jgi:hypothetical protein
VTTKRLTDGRVGFYRALPPNVGVSLEEAIAIVTALAKDFGLEDIRVDERNTGRYESGGCFVALTGVPKT